MYEVLDVSHILSVDSKGTFDSLSEAFAEIGRLLEDCDGNRFEVRNLEDEDGDFGNIQVDARHSFVEA